MKVINKKIILLGNFHVGKTSLINRFIFDKFNADYHTTIGVKISKNNVSVDDYFSIKMIIWDIAGGQLQYNIPLSYYLGTHGIIYVVDITQKNQFENCRKEIESLKTKYPEIPIVVLGNKSDLINEDEIEHITQSSDIEFNFLCSAKSGKNVQAVFFKLAQAIYEQSYA